MLGKGPESSIPPQSDGNQSNDARLPAEPLQPPTHLVGHHLHDEDAGPAILSSDFTDDTSGNPVAAPAAAAVPAREPSSTTPPNLQQRGEQAQGTAERGAVDHIFHIEVSKISPNPNQPRRNFDESALWELARSIREFGFLQPLVVTRREVETPEGIDVRYELIAGERRLLAAKLLGLEYVPAIIRDVDLEREKLELAIIENVQREDLNPIERARAFQRLQEEFRLTQREIAAKLGKSRETIANTVRLLDLPTYIQDALEKNQITESHGRFLLQVGDPAAQKKLFDDILAQRLTTRDLRVRMRAAKPNKEKSAAELSPELKALEEKLTTELGTPVRIERSENTGKIVITFYSDEELQNIVARFGGGDSA